MFFQVYCFKNVGVAGYVEAFEMVQLEKQASYMGYLFRNRCTSTNKMENKIINIDCPVWVLVELLTFGDFMKLYSYYYTKNPNPPVNYKILNLVRNLRNGCAHNNCILADLTPGSSVAPVEIYNAVR